MPPLGVWMGVLTFCLPEWLPPPWNNELCGVLLPLKSRRRSLLYSVPPAEACRLWSLAKEGFCWGFLLPAPRLQLCRPSGSQWSFWRWSSKFWKEAKTCVDFRLLDLNPQEKGHFSKWCSAGFRVSWGLFLLLSGVELFEIWHLWKLWTPWKSGGD